jgi:hypothetical protein
VASFPTRQTLVEALLLRECLRCLLTLDDAIAGLPLRTDEEIRGFARRYLVPLAG